MAACYGAWRLYTMSMAAICDGHGGYCDEHGGYL